jgi:hypothetical protein
MTEEVLRLQAHNLLHHIDTICFQHATGDQLDHDVPSSPSQKILDLLACNVAAVFQRLPYREKK